MAASTIPSTAWIRTDNHSQVISGTSMTDLAFSLPETASEEAAHIGVGRLSDAVPGDRGVILRVGMEACDTLEEAAEQERRLLELGFVEGARIELLHQGLFGRDPIAVRLDDMRVALRRHEARAVEVRFEGRS